jgi:cystathionine beta-lyase/cystathionine gamma-synthase
MASAEGFSTKAIHAGQDPLQWIHRSVIPPLVMSTTFQQDGPAEHKVSIDLFINIFLTPLTFLIDNSCHSCYRTEILIIANKLD